MWSEVAVFLWSTGLTSIRLASAPPDDILIRSSSSSAAWLLLLLRVPLTSLLLRSLLRSEFRRACILESRLLATSWVLATGKALGFLLSTSPRTSTLLLDSFDNRFIFSFFSSSSSSSSSSMTMMLALLSVLLLLCFRCSLQVSPSRHFRHHLLHSPRLSPCSLVWWLSSPPPCSFFFFSLDLFLPSCFLWLLWYCSSTPPPLPLPLFLFIFLTWQL